MYEPQIGDRVRRTFKDGTFLEGVIARVHPSGAQSEGGFDLFNSGRPEQTVLLDRPFKLNTAPGTVYGDPHNKSYRVVRVDDMWLGSVGGNLYYWYGDEVVAGMVTNDGWVEYNLDGSRKNG